MAFKYQAEYEEKIVATMNFIKHTDTLDLAIFILNLQSAIEGLSKNLDSYSNVLGKINKNC